MKKLILLAGVGIGYVLGTKAGRERYEQIKGMARGFAGNPKVQETVSKAQDTVAAQAPVVAEAVKDKAGAAAGAVKDKVSSGSDDQVAASSPAAPASPPLS